MAGVAVVRTSVLPPELDALVRASRTEGFGMLDRLRREWAAGRVRYDGPGEGLYEARGPDGLLGVGGLHRDPYQTDPTVGRVRHLYVVRRARRRGVGRAILASALAAARGHFTRIRLRTGGPEADRFYEALGFAPTPGEPHCSHAMDAPFRLAAALPPPLAEHGGPDLSR